MFDYLIVGAGFTGIVLAERIASQLNKKVLIIDKRNHIGGGCYDYKDDKGVLVHKYGPHFFHTNKKNVFDYLSKFTDWNFLNYHVKVSDKNQYYSFPINLNTIKQLYGLNLDAKGMEQLLKEKSLKKDVISNSEDYLLSKIGKELYETFFKGYTTKQWGRSPAELDKSVCSRIPIRYNLDDRYHTDFYQAMPRDGYTKLFEKMLDHPNISVKLDYDFKNLDSNIEFEKLIYTGPIDEYFDYEFGKLEYRSLRFEFESYNMNYYQPYVQINYPNEHDYTRVVEIKHVTLQNCSYTTIVKEYPAKTGDPFYPVPNEENHKIYQKYAEKSENEKKIHFIGRLAEYRYLNMDQCVANALDYFKKIEN